MVILRHIVLTAAQARTAPIDASMQVTKHGRRSCFLKGS